MRGIGGLNQQHLQVVCLTSVEASLVHGEGERRLKDVSSFCRSEREAMLSTELFCITLETQIEGLSAVQIVKLPPPDPTGHGRGDPTVVLLPLVSLTA